MALNTYLYEMLRRRFGEVGISREKEPATFIVSDSGEILMDDWGEQYCVNCPFCAWICGRPDTKRRLRVGHQFGVRDEHGFKHLWACKCYNDTNCLAGPANGLREELYNMLFAGRLRPGEQTELSIISEDVPELTATTLPGATVPITSLPQNHPAIAYLAERGFDPIQLERDYDIRFHGLNYGNPYMSNRIIIPVMFEGQLVMWQAREVPYYGVSDRKYYNMTRSPKNRVLYNYDRAAQAGLPYVVVVEGVTDVWALGTTAVCPLGCALSAYHIALLGRWPAVFILFDEPDKLEKSRYMLNQLRQQTQVILVRITDSSDYLGGKFAHRIKHGDDPASMWQRDKDLVYDLLAAAAEGG